MQVMLFLVLEESAAGTVNDGFGQTGCTARVEDVKRLRGRQLGEVQGLIRRAVDVSVNSRTHSRRYLTCQESC